MRDVPIYYFIAKLTKLKSAEYKLHKISFIINPNMVKSTICIAIMFLKEIEHYYEVFCIWRI